MNGYLFLNCLWCENISLEQLAEILEISMETLFKKIFKKVEFTENEIQKIKDLLGLTFDEVYTIFYKQEVTDDS